MRTDLKDLLHSINVLGEDTDVFVDGHSSIAVCPPVKLTEEGRKHFQQALTAGVEDGEVMDDDEAVNDMAWELLTTLAGFCYNDNWDAWFGGETATEI